jgi:hypothetical protein
MRPIYTKIRKDLDSKNKKQCGYDHDHKLKPLKSKCLHRKFKKISKTPQHESFSMLHFHKILLSTFNSDAKKYSNRKKLCFKRFFFKERKKYMKKKIQARESMI